MKISWGTGIVITIIVFMVITMSTVVYLMNQDVDLVTDDYYEKEIKYQQQIDKMERTSKLAEKPYIKQDGKTITVVFPSTLLNEELTGEIHLYRPSDSKKDILIPLRLDETGIQIIPAAALDNGLWTVKVQWNIGELDYTIEERVLLQ